MKYLLAALLTLLMSWAPAAGAAELREGQDYVRVEAGAWAPRAGRIEVAEVFAYTCPHCASFEPYLQQWKRRLPADVDVVPVPAAFGGGPTEAWARAFLASQRLGVAARSHPALFQALHERRTLPRNPTPAELGEFFKAYGVDPERFRATMASPEVNAQLERIPDWLRAIGLEGTPTLVVNGRYRVRGRDFDDALRIAEALIVRERAAARTQTSR